MSEELLRLHDIILSMVRNENDDNRRSVYNHVLTIIDDALEIPEGFRCVMFRVIKKELKEMPSTNTIKPRK